MAQQRAARIELTPALLPPVEGLGSQPPGVQQRVAATVLDRTGVAVPRRYVAALAATDAQADAFYDFYLLLLERGDVPPTWGPRLLAACARNWLARRGMGLPTPVHAADFLGAVFKAARAPGPALDAALWALSTGAGCGGAPPAWRAEALREAVRAACAACGTAAVRAAARVARRGLCRLARVDAPLAHALRAALDDELSG